MAIGKVGSFATVEPALVDFGSMVERNIDKIKAEEQAKAAAQAKADKEKRDAVKDIKDPSIQKTTGIGIVDAGISAAVRPEWEKFAYYKSIGDADNAGRSARKINIVSSQSEYLQKAMSDYQAAIKTGDDINPEAYRGVINLLTNLDKDKVKISFEGDDPEISVMNEDGTYPEPSNLVNYIQNVLTPVRNYVEIDDIKKVTKSIPPSVDSFGNYLKHEEIKDINAESSSPQVNELKRQAKLRASQDESMFSWYNTQRASDNKLPFKVSGWTDEEKKKAEEYYFNTFKDSYNREVKAGFGRLGSSGGSGGSDPILSSVVSYNYETSPQEQPKMNQFKALLPDLKGRQFQPTKSTLAKIAGKSLALAFATPGDDPKFVFQLQDTDKIGFSAGGATGGGSEASYEDIAPGHPLYGKALSNVMAVFGVSNKKDLQTLLRGDTINTSQYND
jgi:hypothetical protein